MMVSDQYKTIGMHGWRICSDTAATTDTSNWMNISQQTHGTVSTDMGYQEARFFGNLPEERSLRPGAERGLPDGSRLIIDDKGNYRIENKDAKVTYQANRIREFSPHLNASDMVAEFVSYARSLGVMRDEVLSLPLELFVGWLVIEAAERDSDPVPDGAVQVDKRLTNIVKPKCLSCGQFIPKLHSRNRFPFCDPSHATRYVQKQKLLTN